jgi:hypothetical protein
MITPLATTLEPSISSNLFARLQPIRWATFRKEAHLGQMAKAIIGRSHEFQDEAPSITRPRVALMLEAGDRRVARAGR